MHLTRALNKLICRVLIGVVLFAQFAVASYACPSGMAMDAGVMQQAAEAVATGGAGDLDHQSPNLCAEHCKVGQQSSDTAPAPVIGGPVLDLLYVLQSEDLVTANQPTDVPDPLLAVPPPPHAILHCVFRT